MLGDQVSSWRTQPQDGGMIGVPPTPGPLSLTLLKQFLPHFRADLDVQVGDWVIVTPVRRGPLLNPLIEAWEKDRVTVPSDSAAATSAMPSRAPLNHFAVPQRADGRVDDIELASVSQAKHFFTRRKRPRKGAAQANAKEDAETGKSVILYLHVRLGLLTATPPLVFGGDTESFRALVHIPKRDDEDVSSTELIPLHFRTETSLPPTFPPWLSRVESLAAKEWHGSRLETVFNLPFPGSQAHGRL